MPMGVRPPPPTNPHQDLHLQYATCTFPLIIVVGHRKTQAFEATILYTGAYTSVCVCGGGGIVFFSGKCFERFVV